jgi:6-phosphogluconolactonase
MKRQSSTRREFLRVTGLGITALTVAGRTRAHARPAKELLIYVGTYTSGKSEGIYICRLDLSSGELKHFGAARGIVNPSFLAIDRQRRHLYAVNEIAEFGGKPGGAISAFRIDPESGSLAFINQQASLGAGPCNLTIDGTGKFVLAANYDGGSIVVLPIKDGGLGAPVDMVQHHGSSVNPDRQQGPHAHCILLDRSNRFVFVPDLGLDRVMIYKFDSRTGNLTPNEQPWAQLKPGAGPRHFAFHPNDRWAYVINELDSTMTAFAYDQAHGMLKETQTISTLSASFSGKNSCADLHVSSSGRFLYGSNRGHDSIVVFSIDQATGKLELVEHVSTQGKTPRNFAIDPTGAFLLAANQDSDSIVTFRIDPASGKLSPTGHTIEIPTPVCVLVSDKL